MRWETSSPRTLDRVRPQAMQTPRAARATAKVITTHTTAQRKDGTSTHAGAKPRAITMNAAEPA
ncbi:hypothetical protein [Amycolatopsis pigmentata]|uniref:Uncharacterized protein n=1 Tax=Amycolatopsis pigmentata TaxID=450801 RepID=A0ABW5G4Q3_9PSEU